LTSCSWFEALFSTVYAKKTDVCLQKELYKNGKELYNKPTLFFEGGLPMEERFGFIHDKLDIKLLILYVLRHLPSEIDGEKLAELVPSLLA